ncbi:hypothetical protein [Kribbella deserti]|uniref:Uncharacterized protein n=1 Tax=Kribbella deserti TaxID=1926257 RepID=A0ABV6QD83_9ACTN
MIGTTGRRTGAIAAAIALAGAGAFAAAPAHATGSAGSARTAGSAVAAPAPSAQACLDSVKNVRFHGTNGQHVIGYPRYNVSTTAVGESGAELNHKVVSMHQRLILNQGLSVSAINAPHVCKGAVTTFGISKADGSAYRNVPAAYFITRTADGELQGWLNASHPIGLKDTGVWKVRQVAVGLGGKLAVKPISNASIRVLRASYLTVVNNKHHDVRYNVLLSRMKSGERGNEGRAMLNKLSQSRKTGNQWVVTKPGNRTVRLGERQLGVTGHLRALASTHGIVGLKDQTLMLQARSGGAKGAWRTILVENKSTHANGYFLIQINHAKVTGQELRLHYRSPYQTIASSYRYIGKIR